MVMKRGKWKLCMEPKHRAQTAVLLLPAASPWLPPPASLLASTWRRGAEGAPVYKGP